MPFTNLRSELCSLDSSTSASSASANDLSGRGTCVACSALCVQKKSRKYSGYTRASDMLWLMPWLYMLNRTQPLGVDELALITPIKALLNMPELFHMFLPWCVFHYFLLFPFNFRCFIYVLDCTCIVSARFWSDGTPPCGQVVVVSVVAIHGRIQTWASNSKCQCRWNLCVLVQPLERPWHGTS